MTTLPEAVEQAIHAADETNTRIAEAANGSDLTDLYTEWGEALTALRSAILAYGAARERQGIERARAHLMTPDLLSALSETPGCGTHRVEEIGIGTSWSRWCRDYGRQEPSGSEPCWRHEFAVIGTGFGCAPCLTRLAESVLNHYGPRIMDMARTGKVISSAIGMQIDWTHDWPSLLSALRSETPR